MAILNEYHRPGSVGEALHLLNRRDVHLLPLAGGSWLVGQLETRALSNIDGVVDLRELGLDTITVTTDYIQIGAMTTLGAISAHEQIRDLAQGLLRKAAHGEGPINLRNVATIGGTVATAFYDSEMYAALLALEATVLFHQASGGAGGSHTSGESADGEQTPRSIPLALYAPLPQPQGDLIAGIRIPVRSLRSGYARVARTPSDRPIVAALAVAAMNSEPRVALCGVASQPILAGAALEPPDNFKGSAAYRRAMVQVITGRALAQLQGNSQAT